ncbi:MAG TPA: UDP-glucose 6-dehydrogenase, partial [candidate division Zixibacteria bacterium]|nr:UDP-glucose 6-dehydrogenase [candidate division Zixibacteria bacterium]
LSEGGRVTGYDPASMDNFKKHFPDIEYTKNPYEACRNADIAIFMTEWNEFRELDLMALRKIMRGDALLDPRNI